MVKVEGEQQSSQGPWQNPRLACFLQSRASAQREEVEGTVLWRGRGAEDCTGAHGGWECIRGDALRGTSGRWGAMRIMHVGLCQ